MDTVAGRCTTNAMTVDVEDYFHASALGIPCDEWPGLACRVEANVERLLALLAAHGVHATFFTLGWVAERHPALVRAIVAGGHELASHGYAHRRASEQTRTEFAEDVRRSKHLLEDIGATAVCGYRAPSFSIGTANLWALDVLAEAGYRYSSSIYPVRHDHYGMPGAPRFAFRARPGLLEIPLTTVTVGGRNLPAGGGGFFRLLPYAVSRAAIRRVNEVDGESAVFYVHPWEIDPGQPRVAGLPPRARFRHYVNLSRTHDRLGRLLRDFLWDRVDSVYPIQRVRPR